MTDASETPDNSYDLVPYPSAPFSNTHPDTLATLGTLVGLAPQPIEHCRVLELGCASGGNLIPMAYGLPESEFVGLDLSRRQILEGQEALQELGLRNLSLHQIDILEVAEQFGEFDYIVAHGIYSWVPPNVQDKILEICRRLLRPRGLAFVSYNTYPGWHMRGMVREMMLYHARNARDPAARIEAAKSLLGLLVEKAGTPEFASVTATDGSAYAAALKFEQTLLGKHQDPYIYHEHLEDINDPVYFSEFVRRAGQHGLKYVTEADFASAQIVNFPPVAAEAVRSVATGVVEIQQYMDFLINRTFRQTILCHAEASINRSPVAQDVIGAFYMAAVLAPVSGPLNLQSRAEETLAGLNGRSITIGDPLLKAALLHLAGQWPAYVSFPALHAAAHEKLHPGVPQVFTAQRLAEETQLLASTLLQGFAQGLVELHTRPHACQTQISTRPVASLVARLKARSEAGVPNLRHNLIQLDDICRHLIVHLDGSRDGAELFTILDNLARDGVIVVHGADGKPVEIEEARDALLAETLNQALKRLAETSLLTG